MKNIFKVVVLIVVAFITGCGRENRSGEEGVYFQDFESVNEWLDTPIEGLDASFAYSGRNSYRIDSGKEYSISFRMPMEKIIEKKYTSATISAQVAIGDAAAKCSLVTAIDDDGKVMAQAWSGIPFSDYGDAPKKWIKLVDVFKFPKDIKSGYFRVYLWSPNKLPVYFDDVTIEFE